MVKLTDLPSQVANKVQESLEKSVGKYVDRGAAELHYARKMFEAGALKLESPQHIAAMLADIVLCAAASLGRAATVFSPAPAALYRGAASGDRADAAPGASAPHRPVEPLTGSWALPAGSSRAEPGSASRGS